MSSLEGQVIAQGDELLVRVIDLSGQRNSDWHYHTEVTDAVTAFQRGLVLELRDPAERIELVPGLVRQVEPKRVHRMVNDSECAVSYLLIQGGGRYDFNRVDRSA